MSNDSKLLINEHPLQVLPTLAKLLGLNEAIILQQIHYWLVINSKQKDNRKFKDGHWWVYNAYKDWQANNFPWWSVDTVKRAMNRLEDAEILVSMKPGASDWDHTKWYTIDYEVLNALYDECILPQSEDAETDNRSAQDATNLNRNLEITPETSSEITEEELVAYVSTELATMSGGALNPRTASVINGWIDDYKRDWIIRAVQIARENEASSPNYISAILKRYDKQGGPDKDNGRISQQDRNKALLDEVFNGD